MIGTVDGINLHYLKDPKLLELWYISYYGLLHGFGVCHGDVRTIGSTFLVIITNYSDLILSAAVLPAASWRGAAAVHAQRFLLFGCDCGRAGNGFRCGRRPASLNPINPNP